MSEEAIRKLRKKFMIYAMLSLTLVMLQDPCRIRQPVPSFATNG